MTRLAYVSPLFEIVHVHMLSSALFASQLGKWFSFLTYC